MVDERSPTDDAVVQSSAHEYWLESYDVEPPFRRRRLTVISAATCGKRTDFRWVRVDPPLRVGPHRWLSTRLLLDFLVIAPRDVGGSLAEGPWPLHVYVCRANSPEMCLASTFGPDDISIEYWGTISPVDVDNRSDRAITHGSADR